MYAGTIFEYIDQSNITPFETTEAIEPLFMCGITSDKGPEEALLVKGTDFYKMYGTDFTNAFEKHGQPLIQAARIIDNGGKLFVKRVVAQDSMLANLAIVAVVTVLETQKKNAEGLPLYLTAGGVETTEAKSGEVNNTPIMIPSRVKVKYEAKSTINKKELAEIGPIIQATMDDTGVEVEGLTVYKYPLFVIGDNGRGLSGKKFRISPDYGTSKSLDYMLHKIEVIENNQITDTILFSMDRDVIYLGNNKSMDSSINKKTSQIRSYFLETGVDKYVARVAGVLGIAVEDLEEKDILFGAEKDGTPLANFTIDTTGTDLRYVYGLGLVEGVNGAFGTNPFGTDAYETEMAKFYNGTFTDDIYDLDNIKIDIVMDANYPAGVKSAMEDFVTFREDCMYFGDFGTAAKSYAEIKTLTADKMKNKFCAMYHNFYDVIDPYSKKQITVTICYSLASLMVSHFVNGRNRPVAGSLHSMVIPEAIEGTINFIPKITPAGNQKELMDDLRVNYAGLYDNLLTLENEYTSQVKYSQFSYINNILAIQEVIKAIRTRCPKTRYSFISGNDLEKYKEDVQAVINKFSGNFKTITLEYIGDSNSEANKIFYAAIKVQFKDFVQTEYFKVYALA